MIFTSFLVAFLTRGTQEVMTSAGITNNFFAQVVTGIMFIIILASEFLIRYKVVFKKKNKDATSSSDAPKNECAEQIETETVDIEQVADQTQLADNSAENPETASDKGVN